MPIRGRYSPFNLAAFNAKLDHGLLLGLTDNDHTQYANAVSDTASINLTLAGQSISGVVIPGGVDHGSLAGLVDNDHTQYLNAVSDTASVDLTLAGQSVSGVVLPAGVDHGGLAGLGDNDHTQYVNAVSDTASIDLTLAGQSISGVVLVIIAGTAQGQMLFWDSAASRWTYTEITELFWDDTNKRIGINTSSPTSALDVNETTTVKRLLAGGVNED